jgi:predicted deacylase
VPTVDFDRDGVQHGFLRLPFSRDETARGNLKTPVTVVKRGDGPTCAFDRAPITATKALADLAATRDPADVTGRVIIPPHGPSGLPHRPPAVADRRRQREPHLSPGPAARSPRRSPTTPAVALHPI